ncbi:MAG: hypothetical protein K2X38_09565 [Gemmataceae bacterium]|nr:hypothetical protein [Gemmataceae bacterium]
MRITVITSLASLVVLAATALPAVGQFGQSRPADLTLEQWRRVLHGGDLKAPTWANRDQQVNPGGIVPLDTPNHFRPDPQFAEYQSYSHWAGQMAITINATAKGAEQTEPPVEREPIRETVDSSVAVPLWLAWGFLVPAGGVAFVLLFKWRSRRPVASVVAAALLVMFALAPMTRWWPSANTVELPSPAAKAGLPSPPSVAALFEELKAGLKHPWAECREATVNALGSVVPSVGTPAVLAIASALGDQDEGVAKAAGQVIYGLGPWAKDATPVLVAELKQQDSWRVHRAASALRTVLGGPTAAEAIPLLTNIVKADKGPFRGSRPVALIALNKQAPREVALPMLLAALDDEDFTVRWCAVDELAEHGPAAKAALPQLRSQLQRVPRPDKISIDALMRTIAKLDPDATLPLVD